jgi:tRNA pseudouridine55 synthase
MDGILNIIKPIGMTSHDVVFKVRKKLRIKKVGHTGTLDPNASGVLPICIGQGTKISQFLLEKEKAYRTACRLGLVTDTQDLDGKVLAEHSVSVSKEEVEKILKDFQPGYHQLPPMYSALKVGGRKLYEYAREGVEVPREKRWVELKTLRLLDFQEKEFSLDVVCSKGTYIRTLCHDIGEKLGSGGTMAALERTRSGPFSIEDGIYLEDFLQLEAEEIEKLLYPVDYPLAHFPKFQVEKRHHKLALNGNKIPLTGKELQNLTKEESAQYRIYVGQRFIGIGRMIIEENTPKMKFVKVIL